MALQSSGAISFNNLRTEYGNGGTIALSEMYRGGSFVLNHSNNSGVPTSGTISLNNFYGQNNTAPNWSITLTVGGIGGKIPESGYGAGGITQNRTPAYGSVTDNTVDILGGAFFRQCKFYGSGNFFLEIDGGSNSWSSIVINGNTFNRTSMSKNTDAWSLSGASNPFPSIGSTCTVTMNP